MSQFDVIMGYISDIDRESNRIAAVLQKAIDDLKGALTADQVDQIASSLLPEVEQLKAIGAVPPAPPVNP